MSKSAVLQRFPLYAVAAALAATGLLAAAVPAEADTACTQYGFPGDFAVKQSNGYNISFISKGPTASGRAISSGHGSKMSGSITGGITGRNVNITVDWLTLPFSRGVYNGTVGADGVVHGTTFDASTPSSTATWDSLIPLACLKSTASSPSPFGPGGQPFPKIPRGGF